MQHQDVHALTWPMSPLAGAAVVAVGITLAFLDPRPVLLVLALLATAAGLLLVRLRLSQLLDRFGQRGPPGEPAAQARELKTARLFYYSGLATLGQLTLRIGPFTLSDYLSLVALALVLASRASHRPTAPTRVPTLIVLGTVLWVVGGLLATFDSRFPLQTFAVIGRMAYLTVVWFWLGARLLTNQRSIRVALVCWVCSAAASGLAATAQLLWGDVVPNTDVFLGPRMTGLTSHPNDLGGLTGIALVPALILATQPVSRIWHRLACMVPVSLVSAGLLLSRSVGGLAAALVAGLVWLVLDRSSSKYRVIIALAMVLGVCAFLARSHLDTETAFFRFGTVTASNGGGKATLYSRLETNEVALEVIDHNPLIGVGLVDTGSYNRPSLMVHNLLLASWFQSGLLGVLGIVLLLIAGLVYAWRNLVAGDRERYPLAVATTAGLLAFVTLSMGQPVLYQRYGWAPAALCIALSTQLNTRKSERADVPAGS